MENITLFPLFPKKLKKLGVVKKMVNFSLCN